MIKRLIFAVFYLTAFFALTINAQTMNETPKNVKVKIETTAGDITVLLYDDTPLHRDNFIKLVGDGYYDGLLFHRTVNEFVAQAGDPFSRTATPGQHLGEGSPDYKIDAEIIYPTHFHKRGALAAAREGDQTNPEKQSSGSQFYFVTGKVYSEAQLKGLERRINREREIDLKNQLNAQYRDSIMSLRRAHNFSALSAIQDEINEKVDAEMKANPYLLPDQVREAYSTIGGIPHLDGEYTVFGEVLDGMEVVERITQMPTDNFQRPTEDVRITKMTIIE